MMKKIIAIMFILLIGLMVLGGCTSAPVEPSNQQNNQQNQNPEQQPNQQPESGSTLQPPEFPEE